MRFKTNSIHNEKRVIAPRTAHELAELSRSKEVTEKAMRRASRELNKPKKVIRTPK